MLFAGSGNPFGSLEKTTVLQEVGISFFYQIWPLVMSTYPKNIFLFLNQCGCSKEPFLCGGSFEHPKHMLKLMGKKIFTILHSKILFNKNLWSNVF